MFETLRVRRLNLVSCFQMPERSLIFWKKIWRSWYPHFISYLRDKETFWDQRMRLIGNDAKKLWMIHRPTVKRDSEFFQSLYDFFVPDKIPGNSMGKFGQLYSGTISRRRNVFPAKQVRPPIINSWFFRDVRVDFIFIQRICRCI